MKLAMFAAAAVLLAGACPAFADGHSKQDMKVLHDSAAALTSDHPDLAKRLQRLANDEENESESAEEEGERKQGRDIQLLKESADALKSKRPDLAKGLERFAKEETGQQEEGWKERSENHENERGDVSPR